MADPQQQPPPASTTPPITPPAPAQTDTQQQSAFDLNGARQAGYSDDEILNHLTQSRNFDVDGALKAGYSKAEVANYLASTPALPPDTKPSRPAWAPPQNDYLTKAEDLIGGFTSGAAQNIPFVGKYFKPTPEAQATVVNPDYAKAGELGGRVYEQGLEMAATGGPLKSLAEEGAARYLPALGKYGAPLARTAAESTNAALSAYLHGQPVGTSAAIGGAGAAGSEALQAIAPDIAESALRITDRMRGRGRTIGPAVLEETTGIRPGTIATQGKQQLKNINAQIEGATHDATLAGVQGSTQPAHAFLDKAIANVPENVPEIADKLEELRSRLGLPKFDPANPQKTFTPDELLRMKRGIGKLIKTWPQEWQTNEDVLAAKMGLYGALDGELDRLAPGFSEANQRYSSLKPAQQQATRISEGAPVSQRTFGRIAAHTGALTAAGMGIGYGRNREGGLLPGGLVGGLAGLVGPEIVSSPTGQMAMARLMNLGIHPAIARAIVAAQTPRAEAAAASPGAAGQFERSMEQSPAAPTPTTHSFSRSAFLQNNPGGNIDQAIKNAQQAGYSVGP